MHRGVVSRSTNAPDCPSYFNGHFGRPTGRDRISPDGQYTQGKDGQHHQLPGKRQFRSNGVTAHDPPARLWLGSWTIPDAGEDVPSCQAQPWGARVPGGGGLTTALPKTQRSREAQGLIGGFAPAEWLLTTNRASRQIRQPSLLPPKPPSGFVLPPLRGRH